MGSTTFFDYFILQTSSSQLHVQQQQSTENKGGGDDDERYLHVKSIYLMKLIGDTRYKYLKNKNDIAKINNQNHLLVGMTEIQLSKSITTQELLTCVISHQYNNELNLSRKSSLAITATIQNISYVHGVNRTLKRLYARFTAKVSFHLTSKTGFKMPYTMSSIRNSAISADREVHIMQVVLQVACVYLLPSGKVIPCNYICLLAYERYPLLPKVW